MEGGSPPCGPHGRDPDDPCESELDEHQVPILGGPDEDELIRERLRASGWRGDGAKLLAELLAREDEGTRESGRR